MLERWFRLHENGTTARTELIGGTVTFLTMAYIIVVQPGILSGGFSGQLTGMDAGAIMTATCIASALATVMMALYARYPIALAPGMGENVYFATLCFTPAVVALAADGPASAWQVVLGIVFISGVLFVLLTATGLRGMIIDAISPSLKNAIAAGIGLFIALIGLRNAGVLVADPGTIITLTHQLASPDVLVFFFGLLLAAVLHARRVPGSIFWSILATTLLVLGLRQAMPHLPAAISEAGVVTGSQLMTRFAPAQEMFSLPPSIGPVLLKMNLSAAVQVSMWPFILVFLFMLMFDTMGTLIGVGEQAGFIKDNKFPRVERAMTTDAVGTIAGACLGTSTVTAYIESAAGVEQGARTGLASLVTAFWFLAALFFSPVVAMIASYPPIVAPALVVVGAMMMRSVARIEWSNDGEALPAFLTLVGIPLFSSITDGMALGLVSYAIIKPLSGAGREVKPLVYVLAILLVGYFAFLRGAG